MLRGQRAQQWRGARAVSWTLDAILAAHRAGTSTPAQTVARSYARIRAYDDPAVFISLREETEAIAEAKRLPRDLAAQSPLFGVPVAVKDNIDVAGLPTTAACPAFSYLPIADATAVARLKQAGAIVIGKTNLDQFATGLVGVRSPYGIPRNPLSAALTPGGSSSGSAVAVSAGLVPVALGTDTAGSGRIPAGLNNIVGLKPSRGLVSTTGVVPACRSLDCVSIFALTTDDAAAVLAVIAGPDHSDPYSRSLPLGALGATPSCLRLGVPQARDRLFFGDTRAVAAFEAAVDLAARLGARLHEIDMAPFFETARLLYEGPWLAARTAAVGDFVARRPQDIHPVTRSIIAAGAKLSAPETFQGFDRLAALSVKAREVWNEIDTLMVPTAPAAYTVAELEADPFRLNANLGTYTNFVNLLDLAGLAVPVALANDGTPYGVTFLAPAGQDMLIASLGRSFHAQTALPLGALGVAQPALAPVAQVAQHDEIAVAVVGAHLSGMPLNGELRMLNARFLQETKTSAEYRLFALDTTPPKPGLLRVAAGTGSAIACEIWAMSAAAFGRFVAAVPPPLSIGTLTLIDGRQVKGFLVEAAAVAGASDISHFGDWRAFVAAQASRPVEIRKQGE
jgi:allophanate hydrolase